MVFQPSQHSFPHEAEYDGWFTNLFTREGRAANKQVRAKKKQEKAKKAEAAGKSKKAARLRRKSGKLSVRAADLREKAGSIKPISEKQLLSEKNFTALWKSSTPWNKRPARKGTKWSGGSRRMKYMAEGYRPDEKYINAEYRAVIAGGLTMLASAFNPETQGPGYAPFHTVVNPEVLPGLLRAKGQKSDKQILELVKKCFKQDPVADRYWKSKAAPKTLRGAAEYIQAAVVERAIAPAAWSTRAMLMIGMSLERSRKAGMAGKISAAVVATVGGAVVTVLSLGGAGPLAGAGVASVWAGIGLGAAAGGAIVGGAAAAKTAIQSARLTPQQEIYRTTAMAALGLREQAIGQQQVDYEKIATQELAQDLKVVQAERAEIRNQILRYSLYGSMGILGVAVLYRAVK
jgi:hypothetical protein